MTIERWGADYADPYDFVNILLDGKQVTQPQHNNYAYFNVAKYNKQMTAASLLDRRQARARPTRRSTAAS